MNAIDLVQRGYPTSGADLSASMIERARANAAAAGVVLPLAAVGFGALARTFPQPFDAVFCLGNSLPHLLTPADLSAALRDFAACLHPGGLLLIQNRNFDAVMASRERWMEPQAHREEQREWLFIRFYDFEPDGLINFHILTLQRTEKGEWKQEISTTRLQPLRQAELTAALAAAGFAHIQSYGGLNGSPFDPAASGNLVITARKAG